MCFHRLVAVPLKHGKLAANYDYTRIYGNFSSTACVPCVRLVGRRAGNGTVEFEEFLAMMTRRLAATSTDDDEARRQRHDAELRQAFRVFDIDGDGLIDADELRQTMANLGETLSDHDVRAMIREADRNGDGKVDFDGTQARAQRRRGFACNCWGTQFSSAIAVQLFQTWSESLQLLQRVACKKCMLAIVAHETTAHNMLVKFFSH